MLNDIGVTVICGAMTCENTRLRLDKNGCAGLRVGEKFGVMRNEPGYRWHGSAVSVNGPALRHIRTLTGLNARQLAVEVRVTPDYIRKIENGISRQVGPALFVRLMTALRIDDRRVLLADPWSEFEAA